MNQEQQEEEGFVHVSYLEMDSARVLFCNAGRRERLVGELA